MCYISMVEHPSQRQHQMAFLEIFSTTCHDFESSLAVHDRGSLGCYFKRSYHTILLIPSGLTIYSAVRYTAQECQKIKLKLDLITIYVIKYISDIILK